MSKTIPKVAIITRTKDRPLFLERAIQSVHAQTLTDFVQVIINDAGDPAPVEALIEKYKDLTKGRVKVIHNTESHGMEAASNKAIKSVGSTYVAIHDDDDTWHPEFLERTVTLLDEQNAQGVAVRTDKVVEEIAADGNAIKQLTTEPWMPELRAINLYRQCIDNQMTPITFVYRRSVFDEIGYYDEELPVLGDWDFGIRFLQKHDVEFLDPGFALANYHHRKFVAGATGNSNFGSGQERHRYYANKLMNKYFRQELAEGRLGVGYIMSQQRYAQNYLSRLTHKVVPGFIASRLKRRAEK